MRDKQESKNLDLVAYVFSVLRRLKQEVGHQCKANLYYRVRALYCSPLPPPKERQIRR